MFLIAFIQGITGPKQTQKVDCSKLKTAYQFQIILIFLKIYLKKYK